MCGIAFAHGDGARYTVRSLYEAQRSRGVEGFGFATGNGKIRRVTDEARILSLLKNEGDSLILFHHRFPTSTANTTNTAHPFTTKRANGNRIAFVHNGVISNHATAWESMGRPRLSSMQETGKYNDSEVLMHDFVRTLDDPKRSMLCVGTMAIVAIEYKDSDAVAVYLWRNGGNPLRYTLDSWGLRGGSQAHGEIVQEGKLYMYDPKASKMWTLPEYAGKIGAVQAPALLYPRTAYSTYKRMKYPTERERQAINSTYNAYIEHIKGKNHKDARETARLWNAYMKAHDAGYNY